MKKIFIIFLLIINLCSCSDKNIIFDAKFVNSCNADTNTITIDSKQAKKIFNIFKHTKFNNKTQPYVGCLGSFEFKVNEELISFTIINKDIIAFDDETYKIENIDLYIEAIKFYII